MFGECSNDSRDHVESYHNCSHCAEKSCCDKLDISQKANVLQEPSREYIKVKLFFFGDIIAPTVNPITNNSSFDSAALNLGLQQQDLYKINCIYIC